MLLQFHSVELLDREEPVPFSKCVDGTDRRDAHPLAQPLRAGVKGACTLSRRRCIYRPSRTPFRQPLEWPVPAFVGVVRPEPAERFFSFHNL